MNNEQKQIVGDAYKNYCDQVKMEWEDGAINELCEDGFIVEDSNDSKNVNYRLLTQEEFINKCKTDDGFANTWGLKIEERELSGEERWDLLKINVGKELFNTWVSEIVPFGGGLSEYLQSYNIPTKLFTITYKDSIIENYE